MESWKIKSKQKHVLQFGDYPRSLFSKAPETINDRGLE